MIRPPPIYTLFPYTTLFRSGPEHYATIQLMSSLAVLYGEMGRYAEAEPLHRRGLEIREKQLGRDHPKVADSLEDRKSTRLNSSHMSISYAVFCLKKKKRKQS